MKQAIAAVVALLACLALASTASASWANKFCSIQPDNHCYALSRWAPNVHRQIDDVWWYVNPEDVRFSHPTNEAEFASMEAWASWSVPGKIVEYPEDETYWVEGGEFWTSHGCQFFTSAQGKWAEGYYNFTEAPCTGHTKQLFKAQREPSGEICLYWNANPSWCFEPGFLPRGHFTDLNAGLEVSTEYRPTGISGNVETFALGGIHNFWRGLKTAGYLYTREHATCVYEHGPGPGSVAFSAGDDCPTSFEKAGPIHKWHGENEDEEPRAAVTATGNGESEPPPPVAEEGDSGPTEVGDKESSNIDTFASFNDQGVHAKALDKANAAGSVAEANPGVAVETYASPNTPSFESTGIVKHGIMRATSAGQEAYNRHKTYVVEVESQPELEAHQNATTGKLEALESSPSLRAPRAPTLAGAEYPAEGENLRFVYDAQTGHLDQVAWGGVPTPRQSERIAHRREMFLDKFELERWRKSGGPGYCHKHPSQSCEETFAQEADYKAKLKADKAATKARLRREKEEARAELKREKEARTATLPKANDPRFGHLAYDELSAEPPIANVAIYHHGFRLYHRRGRHMLAHLRVGRRYTFVARGDGLRCARRVRIRHVGQRVRLRWRDCKR